MVIVKVIVKVTRSRRTRFGRVLVLLLILLPLVILHNILFIETIIESDQVNRDPCDAEVTNPGCLGVSTSAVISASTTFQQGDMLPWYRHITDCVDHHPECAQRAAKNECTTLPELTLQLCPVSCNVCNNENDNGEYVRNCYGKQQLVAGPLADQTRTRIQAVEDYMLQEVFAQERFAQVRGECKNQYTECSFWASIGACDTRPEGMTVECAPACFTCEQLDFSARCPFDPVEPGIWQPGDLNRMFERIVTDPEYSKYNITVHSSPTTYKESPGGGPWLLTLEDFISPSECDQLIELGHVIGYKHSGIGLDRSDRLVEATSMTGTSPTTTSGKSVRTSSTAWCLDDCYKSPDSKAIQERLAQLTGIPDENTEYLQLLRYEETQFYKVHTDYNPHERKRPQGVRVLTVFLYLSDVQAGGGTHFPKLDLTIEPKRGRVVVWPSVLDGSPDEIDYSTVHEALAVEAGLKYSVNGWMHQKSYKAAYRLNCHQ